MNTLKIITLITKLSSLKPHKFEDHLAMAIVI